MNRRTFIKSIAAATAGIFMIPVVVKAAGKQCIAPLTQAEKEYVISQALMTDEGKTALARAMCEPIRKSLDYQGVGRKLLMVDDLPDGAMDRYNKEVCATMETICNKKA
jgi:hypothetical protein